VVDILDRFSRYGLPLRVTEFDIDTRDLITAWFSHPSTDNFTMWGFWEGDHWKPNGAMLRTNWTKKPNAVAYANLVLNRWRTDTAAVTDADGTFRIRGFLGDYSLRAVSGGDTATAEIKLVNAGSSVELIVAGGGGPVGFYTLPPYPNPVPFSTRFGFYLPGPANVTLELFDIRGRAVWERKDDLEKGFRVLDWQAVENGGGRPASGVYCFRLTARMGADTRIQSGKLVLLN